MPSAAVRVPATSANLGAGYDAFGLALALHDQFSAQPADKWAVAIVGEGAEELPSSADNLVARAMGRAFAAAGEEDLAARIFCTNRIPAGRGLGSSSAAIVGGMLLADALVSVPLGRHRIFELAVEMEGHPDNVAAALFGGFTIAWDEEGPRCAQVGPEGGLAAVLALAEAELPTEESRGLLPSRVPHADAAYSAGRAGLLAAGLASGRADLVRAGLADRLHEPYRASAVTDLGAVRDALLRAGADGAVLSGAGPTIVGLVQAADDERALRRARKVAEQAARLLRSAPGRSAPLAVAIDRDGARVE